MKCELKLWMTSAFLGAMLLGAGCVKESTMNERYRPAGTPISFSTSTAYENGTVRTEYSGDLYGEGVEFERIDWLSDDLLTITYAHAGSSSAADYVVTTVTGDTDRKSWASVEAAGSAKLTWGDGEGDHVFYGMYPAYGFKGNESASLTSGNHVTGSIPSASQTFHIKEGKYLPPMEYAYMVSYKLIEGSSHEDRATLPFTPAVTTFEFVLQRKAGEPDAKLTGVELTASTPLTGSFAFDITGGNENGATWNKATTGSNPTSLSGTDTKLTYAFPEAGGVSIPEEGGNNSLSFTLLALPVQQEGLALKLLYANGTTKTLALTGVTFTAAKKHVITNKKVPGGSWTYAIGNLSNITVAYSGGNGTLGAGFVSYRSDGSSAQPVPFVLEYSANGTSGWSSTKPGWLTPSGNFDGSTSGQTLSMDVAAQAGTASSPHRQAMLNNGTKSDYDLSSKNWGTGATTTNSPGWTANCYIVDCPGTYKFPLVYGNAFNNGGLNQDAFRGSYRNAQYWFRYGYTHNTSEMYLGSFRDHRDDQQGNMGLITSALVNHGVWEQATASDVYLTKFGSLSAQVVWSDVANLVTNVAISGNYCTFTVSSDYIDEGNALIAVKSGNTIVWSWHIWVTNLMRSSDNFAPVNLGYCDAVKSTYYAPRSYYVRARQDVTGGQTSNVVLVQETEYSVTTNGTPYNTYYQWGRKDPFLPDRYTDNRSLNSASIGTAIQNPTTYYSLANSWCAAYYPWPWRYDSGYGVTNSDGSEGWKYPLNLWNSRTANTKSDRDYNSNDYEVAKTVYDPCPSGYKVPNIETFNTSVNSPSMGVLTDRNGGVTFYSATAYDANSACYWNGSTLATSFRFAALPVRPYRE